MEATGSVSSCQRPSVRLRPSWWRRASVCCSTRLRLTFTLKWRPEDQTSCCVSVKQTVQESFSSSRNWRLLYLSRRNLVRPQDYFIWSESRSITRMIYLKIIYMFCDKFSYCVDSESECFYYYHYLFFSNQKKKITERKMQNIRTNNRMFTFLIYFL